MKRILFIISCLLFSTSIFSQPSWVKKTAKSLFVLKTFSADGQLLGSTNGVFVSPDGVAISTFSLFKGASRAVVIDAAGKEYEVSSIMGANDTYDVAKFRVGNIKKAQPVDMATESVNEGSQVWLLPYKETKNALQGGVSKVETFNGTYPYYTVAVLMNDKLTGAPLFNHDGQLIALAMKPLNDTDSICYGVSALFADSLKTTGLSINDPVLRSTFIKKALPADENQALLSLYIAQAQVDSVAFVAMVNDFIEQFPTSQEGYMYRARTHVLAHNYAAADADMAQALKVSTKPDEVHYSYSLMVVDGITLDPNIPEGWNLDKALHEAEAAYAASPLGIYRQQQASILVSQKNYAEAYKCYEQLFDSTMLQPDVYYQAARCQRLAGDTASYLALLDRCVDHFSKPYLREVAPYLLARAEANINAGNYRKAVNDMNEYEKLMASQVNDNFYYIRFQAEVGGRLFQQALNDIDKAIDMNPENEFYLAEKASLQVRVGLYDEAIETSQRCISLAPTLSDGYLFLGLSQCLKGQKAEGVKNLQRAGELGDPQAAGLIEKYSK